MHFSVPTSIYFGNKSETALQSYENPFVVADAFFKDTPMLNALLQNFKSYTLFTDFTPDPTLESVAKGVHAFQNANCKSLLAIGGGSAIDTAKAILFFSESDAKLAVIPTTSGTGSEVTAFSVVTDTNTRTKYPLISDRMLPHTAILDFDFIRSLPPAITADTGADALCHALESYVSLNHNPFSDALAEKAVLMIMQSLFKAFDGDQEAKEAMHYASTMAGIAFNSAGLGLCHGLAHALGARFKIPHGRANALLILPTIAFNTRDAKTEARYATLSRLLGNEGGQAILVRKLIADIRRLFKKIGIPERLTLDKTVFEKEQNTIASAVLQDACTQSNPHPVTERDILNLYREVM